jgi:hypothetical protein
MSARYDHCGVLLAVLIPQPIDSFSHDSLN